MLTGVVIAQNEAGNISRCLEALRFCDQVLVVDDYSTDNTVSVAKKLGVKVISHKLNADYAAHRNWALEQAKTPWVLFVDADEVITPKLASEITTAIKKIEYKGFWLKRVDFMWGRALKHGDTGGTKLLRLGRRGAGEWTGKVHETWEIEGRQGYLHNPILHYPHPTLVDFLTQINQYSTIRAKELFDQRQRINILQIVFYPVLKFKYLYLVKLGFLDGTAGFVHAMIMAFYSFLVRGKLWLLYKGI